MRSDDIAVEQDRRTPLLRYALSFEPALGFLRSFVSPGRCFLDDVEHRIGYSVA